MKRFIYILLLLPALVLSSCHDDKTADVRISLSYENAVVVNSVIYVVKPDVLTVASVSVEAVNSSHKAANGAVSYWLSSQPIATNPVEPFGVEIPTESLDPGRYVLQISMPVFEEGCELTTAGITLPVMVVESADEIPSDPGSEPSTHQDDVEYVLN